MTACPVDKIGPIQRCYSFFLVPMTKLLIIRIVSLIQSSMKGLDLEDAPEIEMLLRTGNHVKGFDFRIHVSVLVFGSDIPIRMLKN